MPSGECVFQKHSATTRMSTIAAKTGIQHHGSAALLAGNDGYLALETISKSVARIVAKERADISSSPFSGRKHIGSVIALLWNPMPRGLRVED
jgi:hypothetical protein